MTQSHSDVMPQLQDGVSQANDQAVDLFDVFRDSTYFKASVSENTLASFKADLRYFLKQGGVFPAKPADLARFLEDNAHTRNPRSLRRMLSSLSHLHILKGYEDPTKEAVITKIMKGIFRKHGIPKIKSEYMRYDTLFQLVDYFDSQGESVAAIRDKALILLGFFGAFRRSELASLRWDQMDTSSDEGISIYLGRSKADQSGEGTRVKIPARLGKISPSRWTRHQSGWKSLLTTPPQPLQ